MTIRRRILAGHLAMAGLLLVLGLCGVLLLRAAVKTREQDLRRLDTFSHFQTLDRDLDRIIQLHGLAVDPPDPELERGFREHVDSAKPNYSFIRAQLPPATKLASLDWLFLGQIRPEDSEPGTEAPGTLQGVPHGRPLAARPETPSGAPPAAQRGTASRADSGSRSDTAHGTRRDTLSVTRPRPLDPSGSEPWSDGWVQGVWNEMRSINKLLTQKWQQEAEATARSARRTGGFAAILLAIGAPLALISSAWSVMGVRRLLQHLTRATGEIASGRLDLELAAPGNDEISQISRAVNAMSAELGKARRLEADFLAVASHELRTPLALIHAQASMLRAALPPGVESKKAAASLDRIEQEVEHLVGKSSELLTLGRIEAGQLKLDVREFMTRGFLIRTAGGLQPLAVQRRIDFEIALDPSVPDTFAADPDRLEQVLFNLLENALKYTPAGGHVRFSARATDGTLELEVSDTGPGIPPEKLPSIFDKYTRVGAHATGDPGGAGIGLAVVRGIVLAHGGTIEAHSPPGSGTQFLVRLPIRKGDIQDREVA